MNLLTKIGISLGVALLASILTVLIIRIACVDFIENYEAAYKFNVTTGQITPLINSDGTPTIGYVVSRPIFDRIYVIDLRPVQLCISSSIRVFNCKLVSFNPNGYNTFFSWHGIGNYTHNTQSTTSSGTFKDLLLGYAFDPSENNYPFLNILKDTANNSVSHKVIFNKDTLNVVK